MHKAGWGSGNLSWRRTDRNQVWTEQGLWEPCAETASWVNSWPSRACRRGSSGLAGVRGSLGQVGPGGWSAPRESTSGGPGGKAGGAGGSSGVSAVKQARGEVAPALWTGARTWLYQHLGEHVGAGPSPRTAASGERACSTFRAQHSVWLTMNARSRSNQHSSSSHCPENMGLSDRMILSPCE